MRAMCTGCNTEYERRGIGQYFCEQCRTDGYPITARNAEENFTAGGFTLTPLSNSSSGVAKGTSTKAKKVNSVTTELL